MNPFFGKAGAWLRRRAENFAAALLAVMFVAFIVQIVFRYFFNFPIGWTSELSVITWLWLVLWGAAFVVKEGEEIRFDYLYSIYVIFAVAVIVRYLWILSRLLRGKDPDALDSTTPGSGL